MERNHGSRFRELREGVLVGHGCCHGRDGNNVDRLLLKRESGEEEIILRMSEKDREIFYKLA